MSSWPSRRSWQQTGARPRQLERSRYVERSSDIVVAGTLFVRALPVLAIVAIAVRFDSFGPILHRAIRTDSMVTSPCTSPMRWSPARQPSPPP
jgi:lipopolysaccharide/colanic/teichoic acid biosynthesis glycosyltransferase